MAPGVPGLVLSQQISAGVYLETAIYNNFYQYEVLNQSDNSIKLILAQDFITVPLRLQLRQAIIQDRLYLSMTTGAHLFFGFWEKIQIDPNLNFSVNSKMLIFPYSQILLPST